MIPIFDSLVHPTLNGSWILPKWPECASISKLKEQMQTNNVCGAFAVGMVGIGGYEEDKFLCMVRQEGECKLFPIAFFSFDKETGTDCEKRLWEIKNKGYSGIKLHPRIGGFLLDDVRLPLVIDKANELGLVVLLCTYFYSNKQDMTVNNIDNLGKLLSKIKDCSKVVLLHGGGVRLLETMEIVRAFPNTLLDLSLTFCKYAGSSLDIDIKFLFEHFDQRICIGTDHPEFSHKELRERFEYFSEGISDIKLENIAYKNIMKFSGVQEIE